MRLLLMKREILSSGNCSIQEKMVGEGEKNRYIFSADFKSKKKKNIFNG